MTQLLKLAGVITVHCGLTLAVTTFALGQFGDVDFTLPRPVATPFLFSANRTGVSIAYYDRWNMPSAFVIRSSSQDRWANNFESPSGRAWDNGVYAYRDRESIPIDAQNVWRTARRGRINRSVPTGTGLRVWPRRFGVHHWFLLVLWIGLYFIVHGKYIGQKYRRLFGRVQLTSGI